MTIEAENIQCPDCGAAIRPGASFCFKCGKHFGLEGAGSVPAETVDAVEAASAVTASTAAAVSDEQDFSETLPDTPAILLENSEDAPAPEPSAETAAEPEISPVSVKAKPQLTSAAALRRKPKLQREKIEMVWEQPAENSNPVFVIGTIAIFVLVLLIILFVYLLK